MTSKTRHFASALTELHQAALQYRDCGLSFIPVSADGTKAPAFHLLPKNNAGRRCWAQFSNRQPTPGEISRWFGEGAPTVGLGVVAGCVSGNLEIIDFDSASAWDRFVTAAREAGDEAKELLKQIVWVQTPRPGMHGYYRCAQIGGNQKLAQAVDPVTQKRTTLVEIKGEGGLCLAPPSPPQCHPLRRPYVFRARRDFSRIPTLSVALRTRLHDLARSLDQVPRRTPPPRLPPANVRSPSSTRPGDCYNACCDWGDLLQQHNWTWVGDGACGVQYWRRPGKHTGVSATVNFQAGDLLYVFSANAFPFEAEQSYSKFAAYALLAWEGDFRKAAHTVAQRKDYQAFVRQRELELGRNNPYRAASALLRQAGLFAAERSGAPAIKPLDIMSGE